MSKRFISRKPVILLYQDDHYIAVFKPAGILTVPTDRGGERSLTEIVNEQLSAGTDIPEGATVYPCHRLDKETSGVIIYGIGRAKQEAMMDLFREKKVHKKYIAFVHGRLKQPRGEIKIPIAEPGASRKDAREAVTRYSMMGQRTRFAIVEIIPLTGRTNQIRIHFKEIGHPLVGENKFVYRKDYALKFKRVALHAAELKFRHPATGEDIKIEAPLSTDMKNFLEKNRT